MSNVKNYTDSQLLERVKTLSDFRFIPKDYWNLWIRSSEDEFDAFDDKRYLFKGIEFIMVTSCTTNKGGHGTAVVKTDQWLYDGFIFGLHRGRMECLRQNKPFYFYRDYNMDKKTDETGELFFQNIQTQYHTITYNKGSKVSRYNIGLWSAGCLVDNINADYEKTMRLVSHTKPVSGCILKEW